MQTNIDKRPQYTSPETPPTTSWDRSAQLVTDFHNEPEFINSLMRHQFDPDDKTSRGYAKTLSEYAQDYCSVYQDILDPSTIDEVCLIATSPLYMHQQNELDALRGTSSKHEKQRIKELKRGTVGYNQLLSGYIYDHPEASFSAIAQNIIDPTLDHFPNNEAAVEEKLASTAKGARTEAITRHLLDSFGVPYTTGSVDDDLRGGDIILIAHSKRIPVDIKTSLDKVVDSKEGYSKLIEEKKLYAITGYGTRKGIVIFPGFTANQIGDHCSLPDSTVQSTAMLLAAQLHKAASEITS